MTNNWYVSCDICKDELRLRVSIGTYTLQHHVFLCPNCESILKFSFRVEFGGDPPFRFISERYEHCKQILENRDPSSLKVLNLHPEILIPKGEVNNSMFNANIFLMQSIMGSSLKAEGSTRGDAIKNGWPDVNANWKLYSNKKWKLLDKRLKPIFDENDRLTSPERFLKYLFDFSDFLQLDQSNTVNQEFKKIIEELSRNKGRQLVNFLIFHKKELFKKNMDQYFKCFDVFMKGFPDVMQIRIPVLVGLELTDYLPSMVDFQSTEKNYGDLFEGLAKVYSTLGLLNKLTNGEEFNEFKHTNLDNYLASTLRSKVKNLYAPSISWMVPDEKLRESDLRNASHHSSLSFDYNKMSLKYENNNGVVEELPYVVYLQRVHEMIDFIIHILQIDLYLYLNHDDLVEQALE